MVQLIYLINFPYEKFDLLSVSFYQPLITVTKFVLVNTFDDGKYSTYKMSGTADIRLVYWKSRTSSTTDIQDLQCTFNNITIIFEN
jgi:hypothetical protein